MIIFVPWSQRQLPSLNIALVIRLLPLVTLLSPILVHIHRAVEHHAEVLSTTDIFHWVFFCGTWRV